MIHGRIPNRKFHQIFPIKQNCAITTYSASSNKYETPILTEPRNNQVPKLGTHFEFKNHQNSLKFNFEITKNLSQTDKCLIISIINNKE